MSQFWNFIAFSVLSFDYEQSHNTILHTRNRLVFHKITQKKIFGDIYREFNSIENIAIIILVKLFTSNGLLSDRLVVQFRKH